MSSTENRVKGAKDRVNSLQQEGRLRRDTSRSKKVVPKTDAYTYTLRTAYLTYLLEPRARRKEHVAPPKRHVQRSATSINDMVKDFSLIRDSRSTKFPHGFMSELDKRMTGVLQMREKMKGYDDPAVKRTFAAFLNEFKKPDYRKSVEKDRRVEDLLLIFFSNATKVLQQGKAPEDDSWKLMVDRHVALFVRLISATLKDHDWSRERPELATRLQTLEAKLLVHDQDLSAETQRNGAGGTTVEVEVPRSYEVKDMGLVQTVAKMFGMSNGQVQGDIMDNKATWTEEAALQDLKMYQTNLSLNTKKTLTHNDFDLDEGYESWKKAESHDLAELVMAILQSSPELAKTSGNFLPQFQPTNGNASDSGYSDMSRGASEQSSGEPGSPYIVDQPVDMSFLNLDETVHEELPKDDQPYTFIPPDPRAFYRYVLNLALSHDIRDQELQPTEATEENPSIKLLSKQSTTLLNELGIRWRIPQFSRLILLLDVIREKYINQEIPLDTVDTAFEFVKKPIDDRKARKDSQVVQSSLFDRSKWTVADFALNQQVLSSLHDAFLRELFENFVQCYESKPPSIGPVMYVLEHHIYDDPLFAKTPEDLDEFADRVRIELRQRARDLYGGMLSDQIPGKLEDWEFFHVIQLGKSVIKLAEKIQKRWRKNPEAMGVNPFTILVEEVFPAYVGDSRDLVKRIMTFAEEKGEPVPVQDGFDLYKELVSIRQVYSTALPGVQFGFHIEDLLSEFVWRWIKLTDANMNDWVENSIKQDQFQVRSEAEIPPDEERHSVSVVDIFRSFNQSIEQIVSLDWDDDYQYAKFMTAISKTISTGLGRYCELIEQTFTKEMDRLTPQQEAEVRQTRQEKWVQLAKDAWANKEKIEPFQFLPESLVKLNNVEYAILQLDKLEHEVNVDACAEVVQKHEPQTKLHQQIDKYVFTIKIIEAEDLKACDINGLSDPYVVLGDEYQKRLAKTRVVYGNLNPRWDETIDIATQGPLNIIATIWDWDALGDHDCVGRTSLKLDPSHFRDYLPREYWLDLDTQGRLLLRVSMEGERDDIQFYFGKAFRTLKRAERDMTRRITDKLSAYIHHCLSRRALKNLLNKGFTVSAVAGYFNRNRVQSVQPQGPSQADVGSTLKPLFTYFDDNFAIMKQTLTDTAMVTVMTRLWKEVLSTIESLIVPPLSDKPSSQRQLTQQELDIVFKWLEMLFDFFHAVDEEGVANGVPLDILKSPKYHEIVSMNYFYFLPTDDLIRDSERIAAVSLQKRQQAAGNNRLSAPATLLTTNTPGGLGHAFGGGAGLMGLPSTRRSKSIMLSRNLGTMKKAKEEKRREMQAEPSDDIILRILRMRPEAERYLRDRSRQKERLAAAAAAEMIVRQSLLAGVTGRGRGPGR
ncbi:MAG: hypothetical protein M1820_006009 [Bogoriella megaspora]|nr:MAG: hypothetical protein M1820_006009 [Bogoriella megaspora]